jgi:hypothetical protein
MNRRDVFKTVAAALIARKAAKLSPSQPRIPVPSNEDSDESLSLSYSHECSSSPEERDEDLSR